MLKLVFYNKLLNPIICPLDYFKNKKENLKIRREIKLAITLLLKKLKEWKKYKPIRGYIEDFFKVYKQAFNMHKIHKYTPEPFTKNIFLHVLLINQAINTTEKTKTALQQLSQQWSNQGAKKIDYLIFSIPFIIIKFLKIPNISNRKSITTQQKHCNPH